MLLVNPAIYVKNTSINAKIHFRFWASPFASANPQNYALLLSPGTPGLDSRDYEKNVLRKILSHLDVAFTTSGEVYKNKQVAKHPGTPVREGVAQALVQGKGDKRTEFNQYITALFSTC